MRRRPVKKVLHVLGERSWEPQFKYLGSTKDILGRREYFEARGIECQELAVRSRDDGRCLAMLQAMDLGDIDAVLMEHPRYPKSLAWLKQVHPDIVRVIRGHNAELIHQLHTAYAYKISGVGDQDWRDLRERKSRKNARDRLKFDYRCARLSDYVLAIADWETTWYWPFLTTPRFGKILTCPYFLPEGYTPEPTPESERPKRCVSMMSADWTPLAQHAAKVLVDLVNRCTPEQLDEWEFVITGEPSPHPGPDVLDSHGRIRLAGRLESPFEATSSSRALAHLSNLGMGFKTKLLDFVQGGGWILLPRALYRRQPKELRPFCIVVDPVAPRAFARALKKAARPWPEVGDVNERLRARAYAALDKVFSITPRT